MQTNDHIQNILRKFVLNECNKEEIEEVIVYIQSITESNQIPSVEDILELIAEKPKMSEEDANRIHNNILEIAKKQNIKSAKKKNPIWHYSVAAVLIGVLATCYFFKDNIFNKTVEDLPVIVSTTIEPGNNKATLTLEDGSEVSLKKGNSYQTQYANSNGEEITYEVNKRKTNEITYNYLTIPRGGQFHVVLADGTQVWLNSESQLKYPVAFIEGVTRQVELVYGEAYFDVSPSREHKGSRFKVFNHSQEVEVLGTEFNIKAYKDETNIYTTLVEGKVSIETETEKIKLSPNEQSTLNLYTNNIGLAEINVNNEISWKDGIFSFEGKQLKDITKILSRWYDVDFVFLSKVAEEKRFNGALKKSVKINEILDVVKGFGIIKDYEIKDKTILLK